MMDMQHSSLPDGLIAALEKWRGRYTDPKCLYARLWTDIDCFVGVFGDRANGAYEWFVWRDGQLETSDRGYGSPAAALRDVLIKATGKPAYEDFS